MPGELARRFERRSRTYEARALHTELHQRKYWSGVRELNPCFRTGDPGYCPYTNSALQKWSEQRESNSRRRVGSPRHQPLYHARAVKTLAVATGVEPVFPDRQSGVLPPDPATDFSNLWLRGQDSNLNGPGQSR